MIHFTHEAVDSTTTTAWTACGRKLTRPMSFPNLSWTRFKDNVTCKTCLRQLKLIPAVPTMAAASRRVRHAMTMPRRDAAVEVETSTGYDLRSTHDTDESFISLYDCKTLGDVGALTKHIVAEVKPNQEVSLHVRHSPTGDFEVTMIQRK
jgi:hypothetical protein